MSNDHYFHEGESHLDELACSDALMDSLALGKPVVRDGALHPAVQWKPLNTRKRAGELMRDSPGPRGHRRRRHLLFPMAAIQAGRRGVPLRHAAPRGCRFQGVSAAYASSVRR